MVETREIFEWVEAAATPEDTADRSELIVTAIGVALLERYKQASQEVAVAEAALQRLDARLAKPPEIFIDYADYAYLASDLNPSNKVAPRFWSILHRKATNYWLGVKSLEGTASTLSDDWLNLYTTMVEEGEPYKDLFDESRRLSVTRLAQLRNDGSLSKLHGVGSNSLALVDRIIESTLPRTDVTD